MFGDGAELRGGGWPEPVTLKVNDDKQSADLSIATAANGSSYLYVTTAGFAETGADDQGHLTAINLGDGSQHVFNALCSNQAVASC